VAGLHPRVQAGLVKQHERWRATLDSGARRIGWKIGHAIGEVEALMGTQPVVGYLTSATRLSSGAGYRARAVGALRAEVELALRIGRVVDAGDVLSRAREAVDALAVALELVDVGHPRGEVEPVLEANVFHRAFAIGPPCPVMSAVQRRARLAVNGEVRGVSPVSEDYAETVRAAAGVLAAVGEALEPNDWLIAGSLVHVPVGPGDRISADIEGLGRLETAIAS
jgi:2-keto-4-pentenoate hydratase